MAKNFCVIGPTVRTWFEDIEGATGHAQALARKSYSRDMKPVTLFVVQRVKVVELGMPDVITRDPKDSDDVGSVASQEDD